jgi:outer membrane receptor for ferrienterochelin and colicins
MAPIGTDLPLDLTLIDRVEIIRGPGSSLYGTNAVFAVINIITRDGQTMGGLQAQAAGGSLGTRSGTVRFGRALNNGADVLVSATEYRSHGARRLYYPEFGDELAGTARDLDPDAFTNVFAQVKRGPLAIRAAYGSRDKRVPTASYGVVFGDPRRTTHDERAYVDVEYTRPVGTWNVTARGAYDQYYYDGQYPYDYGGEFGTQVFADGARQDWLTGELSITGKPLTKHIVTAGLELRLPLRTHQYAGNLFGPTLDDRRRTANVGLYLQDEMALGGPWLVNAGLRVDRYGEYGVTAAPRAALIFRPGARSSLKLLHGRAFRVPNAYELYYYSSPSFKPADLKPERVATTEGVWEQYFTQAIRSTVSVFRSDISGLITQRSDGGANLSDLYFANQNDGRATGVELEAEGRWRRVTARASHAVVKAEDRSSDERLSNSPAHVTSALLLAPLPAPHMRAAWELRTLSARKGRDGGELAGFITHNLTVTSDGWMRKLDVRVSVFNLFNSRYADPGAAQHVQRAIAQDGRTVRVDLGMRF